MKTIMNRLASALLRGALSSTLGIFATTQTTWAATSSDGIWSDTPQLRLSTTASTHEPWIQPNTYRAVTLDHLQLRQNLSRAPMQNTLEAQTNPLRITIPRPDGTFQTFRLMEAPVMEPELAMKFPEIKTYAGQAEDDLSTWIRLDYTPAGFHAQVIGSQGAWYIDPLYRNETNTYASYRRQDYQPANKFFRCGVEGGFMASAQSVTTEQSVNLMRTSAGTSLRTFRLAIAAQGEYTAFHGGTVAKGLAALVTTVNRVTGIYERDLAIRLVLVGNNNLIVYTSASSDPYSQNDVTDQILTANQNNIDSVIGSANYDVGHVVNTSGGGLAGLGVVCQNGSKAEGGTGSPSPVGDAFDVDYVAHELGHQFGGDHTFNGSGGNCSGGNRNGPTAYEPGSGSTIMGYAGICDADDLQAHSDAYFHFASITQILGYVASQSCAAQANTGNSIPAVNAGADYTIPRSTPFELTATGSDANGDALTYCWEEKDLGAQQALTGADNGASPLFRSFAPVSSPTRTLPRLANILANTSSNQEKLPSVARTMNWRVTVRDNRANGGGVNMDDAVIRIDGASGPFQVTAPNTAVSWSGSQTVTWNVSGTAGGAVNTPNVNILLSTDGGNTFPIVLAANTPNDGSQVVTLPNINSTTARIKVQGSGNIFFDIGNANFTITPGSGTSPTNQPPSVNAGTDKAIAYPTASVAMSATVSDDGLPSGTLTYSWTKVSGPGTVTFSPSSTVKDPTAAFSMPGSYSLQLLASDGQFAAADSVAVSYTSNSVPPPPPPPSGITLAEALDGAGLAWTVGGNGSSNWFGQAATTHDGVDAAQSGGASHNQTNWMQTTVAGPGTLSFWWQVSSEANYDFLRLLMDGVSQTSISGTGAGWKQVTLSIPSGTHTLRWAFERDYSDDGGSDRGWVDEIVFTPATPPPSGGSSNTLTIVSAHGTPSPAAGTYTHAKGRVLTNTVNASTTAGTIQYVNTGWTMTGNNPLSGSGQTVVMTLTNNAVLTWRWATNYWLDTGVSGNGTVSLGDSWQAAGSTVNLTASPASGWSFSGWSGALSGTANPASLLMNGSKSVTALFVSNAPPTGGNAAIANAVDNTALSWFVGGNGSSNWWRQTKVKYDGVDAAESGGAGHDQTNWVQTTVTGPGTVSFFWQVSSEKYYDYLRFRVDGVSKAAISGTGVSWKKVTMSIPSGTHTLRWAFERDESYGGGSNRGWLDKVVWTKQ